MAFGLRTSQVLGVVLVACAAMAVQAPAANAGQAAPSLRLVGSQRHVTLLSLRSRVLLELGVYAASSDGPFELRVARNTYRSPVDVRQVDSATGQTIRDLPSSVLGGWNGLAAFTNVRFISGHHRVVASHAFPFCPNRPVSELERVNDGGPPQPTYPSVCGTTGFPFTKGMVWGLDRGWAAPILGGAAPPYVGGGFREFPPFLTGVPPGKYSVRVSVAKRYRRLFDISHKAATVRLRATVKSLRHLHRPLPVPLAADRPPAEKEAPTVTNPDPSTLPDVAALPAWQISTSSRRGRDQLTFAATEWNAGPAPLVVEGFRNGTKPQLPAYQYFYDSAGNVIGRARVGRLHYDRREGHNHWHFEQFARYMLVDASGKHTVRSHKQSFCIAPSNPVDLTVPGASWQPEVTSLSSACGSADAIWVRESMPAGWGDTYLQYRAGQAINITHVPNGNYLLRVRVNPGDQLYESNPANDVMTRRVHIGGNPGHRWVTARPWRGIHG